MPSASQLSSDISTTGARRIPLAAMLGFTKEALLACGLPGADADAVAEAMIEADLTGADAHGIFRLGQYVKVLRDGRINPKPQMKVLQRGPATALVDGDNGMGHLVMTFATNTAVELAKESGIGWVGCACSPGTSDGGTGTSFTPNSGLPVVRSSR